MRTLRGAVLLSLLAAIAVPVAALSAQTLGDQFTYDADLRTPIAGLPPLVTSTISGEVQSGVALAVRYGYLSSTPKLNNFGATAILPLGLGSTVSLTGGVSALSGGPCGPAFCDRSDNALMLSVAGDTRIGEMPFGTGRSPTRLAFTVNGELGYSQPRGRHETAVEVGVPISLIQGGLARGAMRIVPFVTPEFTFANVSFNNGGGTESGSRFAIGGGVGIWNPTSSVGANFGFQYVAISGAQVELGLNLTLGGR